MRLTYPDGVMVAQEILVLLAGVRLPFGVLSGGMSDGRTTDCKSVEFAYSRFDSYTANFRDYNSMVRVAAF